MPSTSKMTNMFPARTPPYSSFGEQASRTPTRDHKEGRKNFQLLRVLYLSSVVLILLCSFFCIVILYRNTKILQGNLDFLEKQIEAQASKCNNLDDFRSNKVLRLPRAVPENDCPPCPTEPPTNPVTPHKNPVSVLNEDPRVGMKAQYTVVYLCEAPHIHSAVLRIKDDPAFAGMEWHGKGSSGQKAKQSAAWHAIETQFPDLKPLVAEEYIPPVYNPTCDRPHSLGSE